MSKFNAFLTLFAATVVVTLPAYSQEDYRSEVTVQGIGSFTKETTQSGIKQDATNTGGILAGYRFYFTRHLGAEIDYGYTLNTQNYRFATGTTGIKSYSHETTGALVYRVPFKKVNLFALAGAGAIIFNPKDLRGIDYQARAAFVYGAGADYNLTHRLFLRAEYRGLVYNSPTYNIAGLVGTDRTTHRAEPSVGLGFRF
ncbi:MAG TPA: outer membrane beta-barrel protein [Bryobacteraceae bacterium]|nr:outer membrane beta-barrel protein [Bryobacteraceae bacterium]